MASIDEASIERLFMVVATVCSYDGVISQVEKNKIIEVFSKEFASFDEKMCIRFMDSFFSSEESLEDYIYSIEGENLKGFLLDAAGKCAAADGLDLREKVALDKVATLLRNE